MMTSSPPADRTPTAVRLRPFTEARAPPERSRIVVRLLPCIWLLVAAWPPDELREAALLPLLLWPELPCWSHPCGSCLVAGSCSYRNRTGCPRPPDRPRRDRQQRQLPRPRR